MNSGCKKSGFQLTRAIYFLFCFFFRGVNINALFLRGFLVGCPLVGQENGVTEGRPPFVFPCPPPCG